MANPNAPFGFQPLKSEGKEIRVTQYIKATATALYPGDVVKLNSSGQVVISAAGDVMLGVVAEYEAAASTSVTIYDDPAMYFMAQCDADFQLTDIGQNANITATAADTSLLRSKQDIDVASFGTSASLQFKVMGLINRGENAVGSYALVKVRPNSHFFASGVAGI